MTNWKHSLGLFIPVLIGCSSSNEHVLKNSNHSEVQQPAVQEAFRELADRQQRTPATGQTKNFPLTLNAKFSELRGSHEVIFFLKDTSTTEKSALMDDPTYMRPIVFTLTAERLLSCEKLVRENSTKWNHQKYFDASALKGLECGIFRIEQTEPKLRPALRRQHDLIFSRLYMDSQYRLHGIDYALSVGRKDEKIQGRRWDAQENPSSLLWALPIDIPVYTSNTRNITSEEALTSDTYVRNQLQKQKVSVCARGTMSEHKDLLGNLKRSYWCPGAAWPAIIETSQYLAVWKR